MNKPSADIRLKKLASQIPDDQEVWDSIADIDQKNNHLGFFPNMGRRSMMASSITLWIDECEEGVSDDWISFDRCAARVDCRERALCRSALALFEPGLDGALLDTDGHAASHRAARHRARWSHGA